MGDLISRDRLLRDTYFQEDRYPESHLLRMAIGEQPAVDAARVVHGSWYDTKLMIPTVACSMCGGLVRAEYTREYINRRKYNFCPFCGAKMDGEMNAE